MNKMNQAILEKKVYQWDFEIGKPLGAVCCLMNIEKKEVKYMVMKSDLCKKTYYFLGMSGEAGLESGFDTVLECQNWVDSWYNGSEVDIYLPDKGKEV